MRFKILISTTDDKFFQRNYKPPADYIVINQLINKRESQYSLPNVFHFKEKGISKSRNRAIELCDSDIALISDDDVEYVSNIEDIIKKAFTENPSADIITFQAITPEGNLYKEYKRKPFVHNLRTILKVSSIEIAIRLDSVKNKLRFDENFGLGSKFPTGEEVIFLSDALKSGLKIIYLPIPIVIHPKESSGKKFYQNPELIKAKGAAFYRIFGKKAYIASLLFSLKKYKYSAYNLKTFFKMMLEGIKEYKVLKNEK